MMEILIGVFFWLLFGALGSLMTAYFAYIKEGLDVDVQDLFTFAFFAIIAGPFNFSVGILFMFGSIFIGLIEKTGKSRKVIWKADE